MRHNDDAETHVDLSVSPLCVTRMIVLSTSLGSPKREVFGKPEEYLAEIVRLHAVFNPSGLSGAMRKGLWARCRSHGPTKGLKTSSHANKQVRRCGLLQNARQALRTCSFRGCQYEESGRRQCLATFILGDPFAIRRYRRPARHIRPRSVWTSSERGPRRHLSLEYRLRPCMYREDPRSKNRNTSQS